MARKRYSKGRYRKPPRGAAKTIDRKARSMQVSWRRATAKTSTLSLEDARKIIDKPPTCRYCDKAVLWRELSIDHVLPRSRGGKDAEDNLIWVHGVCNRQKGDLTGDEYKALLAFLDGYPAMRESVLSRLRIAGALYGRGRRRRWR